MLESDITIPFSRNDSLYFLPGLDNLLQGLVAKGIKVCFELIVKASVKVAALPAPQSPSPQTNIFVPQA